VDSAPGQRLEVIMGMFGSDALAYVPRVLPPNYDMTRTQTVSNQRTVTVTNNKYADGTAETLSYSELARLIASAVDIA
jgi:hypothetical protein